MDKKGYTFKDGIIVINRDLTSLDIFVKDFLNILKKHIRYMVVSGFVSICTGRTRATEDVDILMPVMKKEKFERLFLDLCKNGFWCYQGDEAGERDEYLEHLTSIRFARKDEMYPNIELVPFDKTRKAKTFEFEYPQKIRIKDFEFNASPIEFEILYKEIILKSNKDMADAKHLRTFFSDILDEKKFKEYKPIVESELE
ncbi:MAG: hypothetical protein L6408_03780 [Nanoarchaeota archaeon]|nr:hypothetical protein [Nanoarchaeota archaeon]